MASRWPGVAIELTEDFMVHWSRPESQTGLLQEREVRYERRILLLFTVLAVLPLWGVNSYGNDPSEPLLFPIRSSIEVRNNGSLICKRITYSIGNYGISDFGNVRLAVAGKPFSGHSSGTLLVSIPSSDVPDVSGRTGVGNRRFEYKAIAGGSSCKFAGLSFDIVHGKLNLSGVSIPLNGTPTLIIVDSKGSIKKVIEFPSDVSQQPRATDVTNTVQTEK